MRKHWNYIKGLILLTVVLFLYAFTSIRNNDSAIRSVNIDFIGENTLYISKANVDKMLIQNHEYVQCVDKEILDLKALEIKISDNAMIESAEAYLNVKGDLRIEIEQRSPLARVVANPSYYIDRQGKRMPLSEEYSARVLLVHGVDSESYLKAVYKLLKAIDADAFLKLYTTDLMIDADQQISMRLRDCSFEVLIGDLERLDQKIKNFKAFYQKAKKDKLLKRYKTVNLKFNQQVVCIK